MTNKLKYFIGNWKMFGDFGSLKIIYQIHRFCARFKRHLKKNKIMAKEFTTEKTNSSFALQNWQTKFNDFLTKDHI